MQAIISYDDKNIEKTTKCGISKVNNLTFIACVFVYALLLC